MTEKEMIEEIAKDLRQTVVQNYGVVYFLETAKELYNLGYRKIPEVSVVLSKEEYKTYLAMKSVETNLIEIEKDKARKNTAREFADKIKNEFERINNELKNSCFEVSGSDLREDALPFVVEEYGYIDTIDKVAKQFGVEVEE